MAPLDGGFRGGCGQRGDGMADGHLELMARSVRFHQKRFRANRFGQLSHQKEGKTSQQDDGDGCFVAGRNEINEYLKAGHVRQ